MPSALWPLRVSRNFKEAILEKSDCQGKRSARSLIPFCQNCEQYYSLCVVGHISYGENRLSVKCSLSHLFFFIKSSGVSHNSFFLTLQTHYTVKGEVLIAQACVLVPDSTCTSSTTKKIILALLILKKSSSYSSSGNYSI